MMLERQREDQPKAEAKYKGRKATTRFDAALGGTKQEISAN
jgi:hypothetical protein